jgi:hypothetical protein
MFGESFVTLVPAGIFFLTIAYGCVLSRSRAEDPKLKMLNSMLRSLDDERPDLQHRRAA